MQVNNCLILNLIHRTDLWENTEKFRNEWIKHGKTVERMLGVNYSTQTNVINDFIKSNRLDLNGKGFRKNKNALLGELGCYMGHYNCWKHIIDNNLECCLILEDGIEFLRNDFQNMMINSEVDILYTNEEMKKTNEKRLVGYGTQGYIVTKKGAQLLINHCSKLSYPIDLQIRELCNLEGDGSRRSLKILKGDVLNEPYVKRNNNRISSIDSLQTPSTTSTEFNRSPTPTLRRGSGSRQINENTNINEKQNQSSIIDRLLINLLNANINLDDYI